MANDKQFKHMDADDLSLMGCILLFFGLALFAAVMVGVAAWLVIHYRVWEVWGV
jgi:hypothetical protein